MLLEAAPTTARPVDAGAALSANVPAVHPASRPCHRVGCLTGQGEVLLLTADGHAHHADDSGDYSGGKQADCC
jgi:hypothetical protein